MSRHLTSVVLEELIAELPAGPAAELRSRLRAHPGHADEVLDDLLTIRPPRPIPPGIADPLDRLLAVRVAARPVQDAERLPAAGKSGFASRVALWQGDLTCLAADVIVNAANDQLLGCFIPRHACIDNAIHRVAGPGLRLACDAHMRAQGHPEPTGRATITGGFHLPARFVAHTVGPIVPDGEPSAAAASELASCYRSVLAACQARGLVTVGFCAISTGVFGYPRHAAAVVALRSIRDWLADHPHTPIRPIVCAFTPADMVAYRQAMAEVSR